MSFSQMSFISQGYLKTGIEDHFKDNIESVLKEPLMFGDYRTALEESEPRLYEDIQDYDAAKALFQEVCSQSICCQTGIPVGVI